MNQLVDKSADLVELNVGGEPVTANRAVLTLVPESMLAAMFSGRWENRLQRDRDDRSVSTGRTGWRFCVPQTYIYVFSSIYFLHLRTPL